MFLSRSSELKPCDHACISIYATFSRPEKWKLCAVVTLDCMHTVTLWSRTVVVYRQVSIVC